MKYLFKNIGPIKNAELELGDLTVIAGGNNTGKTYIAYALYGIRNHIGDFHIDFMDQIDKRYRDKFSDTKKGAIVKGSIPYNVLVKFSKEQVKSSAKFFSKEKLADFFAAPKEKFSQHSVEMVIENLDIPKDFSASSITDDVEINLSESDGIAKYEVKFSARVDKLLAISPESDRSFARSLVMHMALSQILGIMPNFVLPAERFGISLFYRELDSTKNRLIKELQSWSDTNKKHLSHTPLRISKESARYGIPISDHIEWTRNLNQFTKQTSSLSKHKVFDNIQKMMGGYYRHDEDQIFFISHPKGGNRHEMPLHMASSSVRDLSSLYFYLKYEEFPNKMIIVDEPESHLDTKNQIKMARLLAQCVNSGLRVLITTHSDYIVQELNNMIMLHSAPKNEKIRQLCKKQGYNKHHFLNKSKVKGYLCKDGGLEPCKVDDRGMNLQWFDETIKDINNVSDILDSHLPDEE